MKKWFYFITLLWKIIDQDGFSLSIWIEMTIRLTFRYLFNMLQSRRETTAQLLWDMMTCPDEVIEGQGGAQAVCPDSSSVWSWVDLVDHGLSQRLQHLPLVIVKVSVDLVDGAVLHHPQVALSLCDESGVMAHYDHSWTKTVFLFCWFTFQLQYEIFCDFCLYNTGISL